MTRFVALYRMPADVEGFDRDYRHTHLPLVAATPGLVRVEVSPVRRTVLGEPAVHLMAVMHFADGAAFKAAKAAMGSPEWAAAGRNLAEIGGVELATMFVLEEAEVTDLSGTSASPEDVMTD